MALTPAQVAQTFSFLRGNPFGAMPGLPNRTSPFLPPAYSPGGFMNSPFAPAVQAGPSPIMASAHVDHRPPVQINNAGQDFAPGALPQQPNGGLDIAKLIETLNKPTGRHLGIGGEEITQDNPYGNPGGDPFKNGFFKNTAQQPQFVLSGSPNPTQDQRDLINWSNQQHKDAMTTRVSPVPGGDPEARAFWASMGMGNPNASPVPMQAQASPQDTTRNQQAFWGAMGMGQSQAAPQKLMNNGISYLTQDVPENNVGDNNTNPLAIPMGHMPQVNPLSFLQMPQAAPPNGLLGAFDASNPLRFPRAASPMPRPWGQSRPPAPVPNVSALNAMFAMP